ncbi:hypothetical protein K458DRAFT_415301 [Lentithecium fluviatile CBS 122367]|uniref:Uncharacterized protein n=1 Tax=Lentithecium fluviatile CBS 122367 TaxID=1168545 RepID=A0A6G1J9V9_9PLEO|nr:hypothetical protein K458DRAFT_415301 [Lentithecium fluviatile CBS 122367]
MGTQGGEVVITLLGTVVIRVVRGIAATTNVLMTNSTSRRRTVLAVSRSIGVLPAPK